MDYIIPICNMDNDGFNERLANLKKNLECIPEKVHIIMVEQIINPKLKKYSDNVKVNKNCTKIEIFYPTFCKGWLYNVGVRNAKSDDILLVEMDMLVKKDYFENLGKCLKKNKKLGWCFGWDELVYLDKKDKKELTIKPEPGLAEGGIVYCNKDFYWKMGGGNEFLLDLGGMDNELIRRCEFITKSYNMFKQKVYHQWHPPYSKKSSWGHVPLRNRNKRICFAVTKCPEKMIQLLSKLSTKAGNPEKPLAESERKTYKEILKLIDVTKKLYKS